MGMGPGGGMGMGGGCGVAHTRGRAPVPTTPGWGLMTPAERNEHRTQMRSAKSYEDAWRCATSTASRCRARQGAWHHDAGAAATRRLRGGLKR